MKYKRQHMFRHSSALNNIFRSYLAVAGVSRAFLIGFLLCYVRYRYSYALEPRDPFGVPCSVPLTPGLILRQI